MLPSPPVILHPVAFGEGRVVGYLLAAIQFALLNGMLVGLALLHVAYALPNGSVHSYASETFRAGEHDVALAVIPGIVLVLLQHRELNVVYHFKILKAQPQGHRADDINLHQGLPTLKVVA